MLVECSECKQQISEKAYFCPKCGYVRKNIWLEKSERTWQAASIMCGLFSTVIYFLSKQQSPKSLVYANLNSLMYLFALVSVICLIIAWITSRYNLKSD